MIPALLTLALSIAPASATGSEAVPWSARNAEHLLNRAGFGVPHSLAVRLSEMSPEAAVDYLLNYESIPFEFPPPDFLIPAVSAKERYEARKEMNDEERRELQQKIQREECDAVKKLQAWWLQRMRATPRPLEEKMALFWNGHFATSAQKVKASEANYDLYGPSAPTPRATSRP